MDSLKKNTESSKAELKEGLQAVLGLGRVSDRWWVEFMCSGFRA